MRLSFPVAMAAVSLLAVQAFAQTGDPAWLDTVGEQAASKLGCEVTLFLLARESESGGLKSYEVRIQCADGRRFDASRVEPETDFTFQACDTQVC